MKNTCTKIETNLLYFLLTHTDVYTPMQKYTYHLKFDKSEKYVDFCEKRKVLYEYKY